MEQKGYDNKATVKKSSGAPNGKMNQPSARRPSSSSRTSGTKPKASASSPAVKKEPAANANKTSTTSKDTSAKKTAVVKAEKAPRAITAKKERKPRVTKEQIKQFLREFLRNEDEVAPRDIVRIKGGIDRPMLIIIILLLCFGSVMVFSSSYAYALSRYNDSYYFIRRQLLFAALGVAAMLFITLFDYRTIRKFTNIFYLGCVGLLAIVLVVGLAQGAAKRWISIGGFFTLQPSELMKLGVVLLLANYYYKRESFVYSNNFIVSTVNGTIVPAILLAFSCFLVVLEHHISGTIILFLIGMIVIFVGGAKKRWLAIAGAGAGVIVAFVIFTTSYATKRLDMWIHPENYSAQSDIWQSLQGLYAVGSGGIFGVGLGNGRQKMLFVSMPQNDFIYSILCEELGFIGAVMVIILFGLFVWRGYKIAQRAPDTFSRLAAIGITSKVGIQALLNIAVVTGSIPNTGISLPFFSYGGTSLIVQMAEMGVLLTISRYSSQKK